MYLTENVVCFDYKEHMWKLYTLVFVLFLKNYTETETQRVDKNRYFSGKHCGKCSKY